MPDLTLESSDAVRFVVDAEVAKMSITIREMYEGLGETPMEGEDDTIPLYNVRGPILKLVIQWATHHKDDPQVAEEESREKRSDDIIPWDAEFINVDQPILFDLILAANYLDIKGLLDTCCKAVANMIKGKTPEEIRRYFSITNDFSPADEEQIRKENEWCKEK